MLKIGSFRKFKGLPFFFFLFIQDNFHNLGPSQRALNVLIKFKIILSFAFSKIYIDINWSWVEKTIPWWGVLRSKKDYPSRVLKFYSGNTLYTSIIIIFASLSFVSLFVCVIFFVVVFFFFFWLDVKFRDTQ